MKYRESMKCTEQEFKLAKKLAEKASKKTQIYYTPLFPSDYNKYEPTNEASGTFVIINGQNGILTNAHVTDIFGQKNSSRVLIPDSSGNPTYLLFSKIIFLPKKTFNDIDMAFIQLTDEACNKVKKIGKKFWNLDDLVLEWEKNNWHSTTEKSLWIIHGNVAEGRKVHRNCNPEYIEYKNSGPYIVVPDLKSIKEDRIICQIKTEDHTPESFGGMSGGALWQVIVNEKLEILQILLRGIATKEYPSSKKTEYLICHGPVMIYEIFYPFCVNYLQHNKVDHHLLKNLLAKTKQPINNI